MSEATTIELAKCATCHHRFVPADGVCPRCASREVEPFSAPALATVLASTSVVYPASGWPSPHPLALVELTESVRLLVVASDPPPAVGDLVALERREGRWHAVAAPSTG